MQQKRQIIYVVVAMVIALLAAGAYILLSKPAVTPEVSPEPVMTPEERLESIAETSLPLSDEEAANVAQSLYGTSSPEALDQEAALQLQNRLQTEN